MLRELSLWWVLPIALAVGGGRLVWAAATARGHAEEISAHLAATLGVIMLTAALAFSLGRWSA